MPRKGGWYEYTNEDGDRHVKWEYNDDLPEWKQNDWPGHGWTDIPDDMTYSEVVDKYDRGGSSGYRDSYSDYLREAQREAERALRRRINAAVDTLNAQKPVVEQTYNDSAREAYINYMNAKKNLPQQLSAQGLTGGVSESSNIALESSYGNNLNDLTVAKNNQLAAIDQDINQVRAEGDASIAENAAQYNQLLAQAAQEANARALEQQYAQWEYEQQANAPKITYAQAMARWEDGYRDDSTRDALEYYLGTDDAAAFTPTVLNTGGGYSGSAREPRLTYSQAWQQWQNGNRDDPIRNALSYYLEDPDFGYDNLRNQNYVEGYGYMTDKDLMNYANAGRIIDLGNGRYRLR